MEKIDNYQTVEHFVKLKRTINKSSFIAFIKEVENKQEAKMFLKSIVQQFPDATHHCWAYQIGIENEEIAQYSDAGEPANSAGPPILQAIRRENITNTMVVVIRYFGGIKLGISGLRKSYRDIALKGLQLAGKKNKYPLREFMLEGIGYQSLGAILQSIESQEGRIVNVHYGKEVKIIVCLSDKLQEWIIQIVKNNTQGEGCVQTGKLRWYHK
jgi:uncharacterized YigZ family protein